MKKSFTPWRYIGIILSTIIKEIKCFKSIIEGKTFPKINFFHWANLFLFKKSGKTEKFLLT